MVWQAKVNPKFFVHKMTHKYNINDKIQKITI